MSLPATRLPLPHVGTARSQGPDLAACADPKIGGLLWGRQFGHRTVCTNDVPDLQCRHLQDFPQAVASPANPRTPLDRRARQRSVSSRKAPGRFPSSPCSTVASAVPAALQPATGSNRAGVEAHSAPCHSQPLLRHTGRSVERRQRLLRSLAQAQQGAASIMLHYLVRRAKARSSRGCESHPANCRSSR
jgi:hypothetical protein